MYGITADSFGASPLRRSIEKTAARMSNGVYVLFGKIGRADDWQQFRFMGLGNVFLYGMPIPSL